MQQLPPDTIVALAVTAAAGVLMMRVGLGKHLLARRTRLERCASCGHLVRGAGCTHCRRRRV